MVRRRAVPSAVTHRVRAAVALLILVAPTLAFVGATASPASAEGGLQESATTTYVVDPAAGAVHVTVYLTVTNTSPDQHHDGFVDRTYYPGVIGRWPKRATSVQ
jgi:hypothetical protein